MSDSIKKASSVMTEKGVEELLSHLLEDAELSSEQQNALRDECRQIRKRITEEAKSFEETDTMDNYLALRFVELKSRWIILNARIQDFNRRLEVPDMFMLYQSSMLSSMIGMLEEALPRPLVASMNESLASYASGLEETKGPYVVIEGNEIIIEGKRKVLIYKKASEAEDES
jgi:hypothetical protein